MIYLFTPMAKIWWHNEKSFWLEEILCQKLAVHFLLLTRSSAYHDWHDLEFTFFAKKYLLLVIITLLIAFFFVSQPFHCFSQKWELHFYAVFILVCFLGHVFEFARLVELIVNYVKRYSIWLIKWRFYLIESNYYLDRLSNYKVASRIQLFE